MRLIGLILILIIYFIPTIAAYRNEHKNLSSIAVVNLLLGWTLVGWVIALAWALKKE